MTARSVLLDTSGWIALLNSSDVLHDRATQVWNELLDEGAQIILTDWIVAETGNGLARSPARRQFPGAVQALQSSPRLALISAGTTVLYQALEVSSRRSDKAWGLVDCASFVLMQERGIQEALTVDRHFEQAGFRALLRDQPFS